MAEENAKVQGANEIIAKATKLRDYLNNGVKIVIGTEAKQFFRDRIVKGDDKWAPRKIPNPKAKGILHVSEALMNSIDYEINGDTVTILSDLPYSEIHNEGGEIEVTEKMKKYFWSQYYAAKEAGQDDIAQSWKWCALAKKIVIPKREFIGSSPELTQRITDKVSRDIDKIMQP